MELPPRLRYSVDQILDGIPLRDLRAAAQSLSDRYRREVRDGRLHMNDDISAKAYLAVRMPATYAAVRAAMDATAEAAPDFAPKSLLDVGAGPGTALWAATDCWPDLRQATLIEASAAARQAGTSVAEGLDGVEVAWQAADVTADDLSGLASADLVTLAYVLDELAPVEAERLTDRLWMLTAGMLLIVEPGTPAGWRRILTARDRLLAAGAHIAAPCPHQLACPLIAPDWCHFARRVARSKIHRLVKDVDVPWEDEKFIYLAATRDPLEARRERVLAPPRTSSGMVQLKLCTTTGVCAERTITKRDGAVFKTARRVSWGDGI